MKKKERVKWEGREIYIYTEGQGCLFVGKKRGPELKATGRRDGKSTVREPVTISLDRSHMPGFVGLWPRRGGSSQLSGIAQQ
jgi:hypothetical protein